MGQPKKQNVRTTCAICSAACGLELAIEAGRILSVKGDKTHPFSRGYVCPKGMAVGELVEISKKFPKPLKKNQQGMFQEIEWDDAIQFIAEKLSSLKEKHGPESVAFHVGQAGVSKESWPIMRRFSGAFGSPNFSTASALCHLSKTMANIYTYGSLPVPDYENSNCIVIWGYNPANSAPPVSMAINKGISKGAKLIVVDPVSTPLAKKADIHLRVRPGTDGALALGLLHVVISENLYDRDFVNSWTIGFEALKDRVSFYSPEKVEGITWVPSESIKAAARLYAKNRPGALYPGNALELHTNGFQAVRAISVLQSICGNLDIAGGSRIMRGARLSSMKLPGDFDQPPIGLDEFPLFYKSTKQAQSNLYSRAILEEKPYSLKGLFILGANPMLTWPNVTRIEKALKKVNFLAVVDNYMTPTAKMADIFIPTSTFLSTYEFWDAITFYGTNRLGIGKKVIDDARPSDWEFIHQLSLKMGYDEILPWKDYSSWMNARLKYLDTTVDDLKSMPEGKRYGKFNIKNYEKIGFNTLSGKVEIYSSTLETHGYEPLPDFVESTETPFSTPDLAKKYPLVISTGARSLYYHHSRHRNLPSLIKARPEPYLKIHPEKAADLGIETGDEVIVESKRGKIFLKAVFDNGIDPRIVTLPHGWWPANANLLTDDGALDPVTGYPSYRSFLVNVRKKN